MAQEQIAEAKASNTSWLWLCSLGMFGLFALTNDKSLVGIGLVLLGVFAFFNTPMKFNEPIPHKPGKLVLFSWASGLVGVLALLSAALTSWT